jgi:NADP-dependent 3-hydroxy acid dehydrogenase YdfG
VTGATRGIGREVVRLLTEHRLVLVGRDRAGLEMVASTLPCSETVVADLDDLSTLPTDGWPERVDGLVHCAGVAVRATVAESAPETYAEMFATNVVAVAELTRILLPALRAAGGTVVLLSSGQGLRVTGSSVAYAASKHALRAYADALRQEEPALRVTSVYPGRVATDMQRQLRAQEHGPYEPERYLAATTVARVVVDALRLPGDAVMTDVRLVPRHD